MGKFQVKNCEIEGLKVITPTVFGDERGYFMETYQYEDFKAAGIDVTFVQDNQSMSVKGVLRGLHFQKQYPQTKLVRAIKLPLALYRIEGGYGVHPRWSDVVRRGGMRSCVSRVIEPEEYANMLVMSVVTGQSMD